ncbi:MAG: hypothetical protein JW769_00970 [Parachlamydiales bacterium]|nr:hypothetical protein [Parachlamydiales bacterium]
MSITITEVPFWNTRLHFDPEYSSHKNILWKTGKLADHFFRWVTNPSHTFFVTTFEGKTVCLLDPNANHSSSKTLLSTLAKISLIVFLPLAFLVSYCFRASNKSPVFDYSLIFTKYLQFLALQQQTSALLTPSLLMLGTALTEIPEDLDTLLPSLSFLEISSNPLTVTSEQVQKILNVQSMKNLFVSPEQLPKNYERELTIEQKAKINLQKNPIDQEIQHQNATKINPLRSASYVLWTQLNKHDQETILTKISLPEEIKKQLCSDLYTLTLYSSPSLFSTSDNCYLPGKQQLILQDAPNAPENLPPQNREKNILKALNSIIENMPNLTTLDLSSFSFSFTKPQQLIDLLKKFSSLNVTLREDQLPENLSLHTLENACSYQDRICICESH